MSERTALYRFYDQDDRLLYVGITEKVAIRWRAHARQSLWWHEVSRKTVAWFPSRDEAATAEVAAIQEEHPLYNITHAVRVLTPEQAEVAARSRAELKAAEARYLKAQQLADQAKAELFDLCAEQVRAGKDTADTLAPRTPYTAVTIRKALRARGVARLRTGRKTREQPADG